MFNYFVRRPITYTLERIRGTGIFAVSLFSALSSLQTEQNQNQHMTEQQAYLYSLTNRAKEAVRLVHSICQVESVYVCGFVCVRMCMVCWLLTLGMAVVC